MIPPPHLTAEPAGNPQAAAGSRLEGGQIRAGRARS